MTEQHPGHNDLRQQARERLRALSQEEREGLLVSCWMSHDARWFNAVAEAFGFEAANRLNLQAAHAVGRVEARRVTQALGLPPVTDRDSLLLAQETLIALLGPDLLDYEVEPRGADAYDIHVRRCFAYDNVTRAGVAGRYDCGIFARVTGWFETIDLQVDIAPSLGRCLKAQGRECIYTMRVRPASLDHALR